MRNIAFLIHLFLGLLLGIVENVYAASYPLPEGARETVIGESSYITTVHSDTLPDLARHYDLGYDEIVKANSTVSRWLPGEGTKVLLPTKYVLPDTPREGIVINLAELRLYYYPPAKAGQPPTVFTYPISIGRMDWKSPLGKTKVEKKEKDPAWHPTESIKAEHAMEGDNLPDVIPGGTPENPLGHYALRLGLPGFLIHGTDETKEYGIGMRVTHGCIRMYPEDIEQLYGMAQVNTPVTFVDQPVKAGWRGGELFLEVHSPLHENEAEFQEYSHLASYQEASYLLSQNTGGISDADVARITSIVQNGNGVPTPVFQTASLLPPARIQPDSGSHHVDRSTALFNE